MTENVDYQALAERFVKACAEQIHSRYDLTERDCYAQAPVVTATFEAALRALRAEGAAPRPAPFRNPRRDYDAEIEQLRAQQRQDAVQEA